MRFVPTRLTPKGKVKPRGQASAPIPSQTTLGQRLLRGLPGSLRRVRHGGALYRAHPPLPAHGHRPRQPLCPSCFVLALCLGRFVLAIAAPRHDSEHTARFAALVKTVFPGRIEQILTDNGSEFQSCRLRSGARVAPQSKPDAGFSMPTTLGRKGGAAIETRCWILDADYARAQGWRHNRNQMLDSRCRLRSGARVAPLPHLPENPENEPRK